MKTKNLFCLFMADMKVKKPVRVLLLTCASLWIGCPFVVYTSGLDARLFVVFCCFFLLKKIFQALGTLSRLKISKLKLPTPIEFETMNSKYFNSDRKCYSRIMKGSLFVSYKELCEICRF